MKKRQIYMVELSAPLKSFELDKNSAFIENFQTALLLSLLENKKLTGGQFELCAAELKKTRTAKS